MSEDSDEFSENKCVICKEGFDGSHPSVSVHQKGMKTIIKTSKERDLLELSNYLQKISKCKGSVMVHHSCRRKFTDSRKRSSGDVLPKKNYVLL